MKWKATLFLMSAALGAWIFSVAQAEPGRTAWSETDTRSTTVTTPEVALSPEAARLPPIDRQLPARIETATFGLG